MGHRWLRHPILWSPILAIVVHLAIAATAAAVTGGGDFPRGR